MYNSFLIFDFGANEDAAQQARHKLDGWKQAFRLDKKLLYKFERQAGPESAAGAAEAVSENTESEKTSKSGRGKSQSAKATPKAKPSKAAPQPADGTAPPSADIKLLVRLYFSGHEKLSHQRWVDRIPTEEPFKQARPQTIRAGDAQFADVDQKFDMLE